MITQKELLRELKSDVREAHSALRLAIKDASSANNYIVFLDMDEAKRLSDFLDVFIYE